MRVFLFLLALFIVLPGWAWLMYVLLDWAVGAWGLVPAIILGVLLLAPRAAK